MAAGAALAGVVIPADICYVDTDNYLIEFGMTEPGSEYMRILEGPDTLLQIARRILNRSVKYIRFLKLFIAKEHKNAAN